MTVWKTNFVAAGIANMTYIPPFSSTPRNTSEWPTLGEMISSGKRVVVFIDANANSSQADFILDEFTYMWETPFDQTNQSFPCIVDRPGGLRGQIPTGRLSVINHFLDSDLGEDVLVPDRLELDVTNAFSGFGSLGQQAIDCEAIHGSYANFFLVDCTLTFNDEAKLQSTMYPMVRSFRWRRI